MQNLNGQRAHLLGSRRVVRLEFFAQFHGVDPNAPAQALVNEAMKLLIPANYAVTQMLACRAGEIPWSEFEAAFGVEAPPPEAPPPIPLVDEHGNPPPAA